LFYTVSDLEALRREKINRQLPPQNWNAATNLFLAATNAAIIETAPIRVFREAVSLEKGAASLRSPRAYSSTIPAKSALTENGLVAKSSKASGDVKGATALMPGPAPAAGSNDPDGEHKRLAAVEMAPGALPTLASERAKNVKAYLLRTGKVEPRRITESARGASSSGSRVYVWLQ
jgi:hypothetical protein